jgi:hypothetical protein
MRPHRHSILVCLLLLGFGCSAQTPEQKLAGKWIGTAPVKEAVDQAVNSAAQGKEVNPLARGAARFLGQKLAEAMMSVQVDFRSNGIVFFRGNTDLLGLPSDSDGTWEVSSAAPDVFQIRFGIDGKQLQGKVVFRDKDEFTLKLDTPVTSSPGNQPQDKDSKPAKEVLKSILFKRDQN